MQAMVLMNRKRHTFLYTLLWTHVPAGSATNTAFCYEISFLFYLNISKSICLPKDGIHSKIKILDFCMINTKDNSNASSTAKIK